MLEMGESLSIVNQTTTQLLTMYQDNYAVVAKDGYNAVLCGNNLRKSNNYYGYMEDLIEHFLNWHTGELLRKNLATAYIESPKGEFGVNLVSDNTNKPLRCKIRSPSYFNLQFLPQLTKNHFVADLATLIGTIDIVFGEVDR